MILALAQCPASRLARSFYSHCASATAIINHRRATIGMVNAESHTNFVREKALDFVRCESHVFVRFAARRR